MEEMSKEMGQVSNLIGLLAEDIVVVTQEGTFEEILELILISTEALGQQSEEGLVDTFHHAALQNHIHQLVLITLGDVHLKDLVCALLEVYS